MLNNSTENLFGGINKIIAEKYAKMHIKESDSVSDLDQTPKEGETQLDETGCADKKIEEARQPFDVGFKRTHLPSGRIYYGQFNRTHHDVFERPLSYPEKTLDNVTKNAIHQWNGNQPTTWKYELQPEISKHLHLNEEFDSQLENIVESAVIQESQDYNTFLKREDFESKLNELGLKAEHNGKDHDEVKDNSGDLKGWWNGHTGVGYLRKDCCKPVTESIDQQQEPTTHTESGDLTSDESLKIAIQTAANRAKESGTHYHDEIIKELGSLGMDPMRHSTHAKLDNAVSSMTNGKYTCHSDFGNDHVAGQLKEDVTLETPVVESVLIPTDKLEEAHLTPELTDKIEEYVNKLNPKMSEFQDKYGDSAESVMYGTATKLAKNDLGIKD